MSGLSIEGPCTPRSCTNDQAQGAAIAGLSMRKGNEQDWIRVTNSGVRVRIPREISRKAVRQLARTKALVLVGVLGTLTGLLLGLLFCLNIGSIQHFLEALLGVQLFNADVYMLDAIPAEVDPLDVFWVTVWSFFMSCVAGLIPSWQAARLDPVEALRYE